MDLREQIKRLISSQGFSSGGVDLMTARLYQLMIDHNPQKRFPDYQSNVTVSQEDIDEVYKAYPTKCVVRGTSTGKGSRDKLRIKHMLHKQTKESIIETIGRYANECFHNGTFMKNFGSFLGNMPDYREEDKNEPSWWLSDDVYSVEVEDEKDKDDE